VAHLTANLHGALPPIGVRPSKVEPEIQKLLNAVIGVDVCLDPINGVLFRCEKSGFDISGSILDRNGFISLTLGRTIEVEPHMINIGYGKEMEITEQNVYINCKSANPTLTLSYANYCGDKAIGDSVVEEAAKIMWKFGRNVDFYLKNPLFHPMTAHERMEWMLARKDELPQEFWPPQWEAMLNSLSGN
jgi:hypothetical protein